MSSNLAPLNNLKGLDLSSNFRSENLARKNIGNHLKDYKVEIVLEQRDYSKLVEQARKHKLSVTEYSKQILLNKLIKTITTEDKEWDLINV